METDITGKWEFKFELLDIVRAHIIYEFFKDGTYKYNNYVTGAKSNARYSVTGNRINFLDFGSAEEFTLNGNNLTMTPIKDGNPLREYQSTFKKI
jgi:hypothetical protein